MAVVGVMALLAVVAVPALKGLTGSGGRKQALGQLMGALEVARNTAISSGTNAAVIFPDSTFPEADYRYRAMAVVAWNATNTNTPPPNPTMVGPWIVLPQGISFFPNSLASAKLPSTNVSYRVLTTTKTATLPAVIFQSDGALAEDVPIISTNRIAFFEGTVTGTTTNPTSRMTNFESVRVYRYSGRAEATLAPAP